MIYWVALASFMGALVILAVMFDEIFRPHLKIGLLDKWVIMFLALAYCITNVMEVVHVT